MKITKYLYLIVIGIFVPIILLSGCREHTNNASNSKNIDRGEDPEFINNSLFEAYVAACEQNNAEACFKAGQVYSSDAYKASDYNQETAATKVAQFYLKSCKLGFAKGCTEYGMMFSADTQRDESKNAKYYFEKACDGGDTAGCNLFRMAP